MKVELKAVKFFPSMSEETNCFQATIYIDGKKVGWCENRGTGGCTDYSIENPVIAAAFDAYAKSLPDTVHKMEGHSDLVIKSDGEGVIDDLFEAWIAKKEEDRLAKISAKEKAKLNAKGYIAVEIRDGNSLLWFGVKSADLIQKHVEQLKAKHKFSDKLTYRVL
jgi:hypothetical protein